MKIFYRTTGLRISLLFLSIYAISYSIVKDQWIFTAIGSLLILMRESLYNNELMIGTLHYIRTKLAKNPSDKITPEEIITAIETLDDMENHV